MGKRILILGAGPGAVSVVERARALGLHTIAMDPDSSAPTLERADEKRAADWCDPERIVRIAAECRVDGIYPAPEHALIPLAEALERLGLPGPRPGPAALMRDKAAMREAFRAAGVSHPPCREARNSRDATDAARELGLPVTVSPVDSVACKGVREAAYAEDVPLAFSLACRASTGSHVLIESKMAGDGLYLEGIANDGDIQVAGILGREPCDPPGCYDRGVFASPRMDDEEVRRVTTDALGAIGFTSGYFHAEVFLTQDGPRVIGMAPYPICLRLPGDPIRLASGIDTLAVSIQLAVGERPDREPKHEGGAAIYWIAAQPGVVTEIGGIEEARAVPGVKEVVVAAEHGDVLGHAVDEEGRDRIGYVIATGANAAEAKCAAQRAAALCRIVGEWGQVLD